MSEEGGHGVAADAAESATQQSGIKLIPGPCCATVFHYPVLSPRFHPVTPGCLRVAPSQGEE
jgi:hypothetical protein